MIDIYEKSGNPSQRLLVRERQPLPSFADAAEWSHVGTRETVGADWGSAMQNLGYALVTGNTDAPLQTDWEGLFGGSETAPTIPDTPMPRSGSASTAASSGAGAGSGQAATLAGSALAPLATRARDTAQSAAAPAFGALERSLKDRPVQTLGVTLLIGFLLGLLP